MKESSLILVGLFIFIICKGQQNKPQELHFNKLIIENKDFFRCPINPFFDLGLDIDTNYYFKKGWYDSTKILNNYELTIIIYEGNKNFRMILKKDSDTIIDSDSLHIDSLVIRRNRIKLMQETWKFIPFSCIRDGKYFYYFGRKFRVVYLPGNTNQEKLILSAKLKKK